MLTLSGTEDDAICNAYAIVATTSYTECQLALEQRFCVLQIACSLCKARRSQHLVEHVAFQVLHAGDERDRQLADIESRHATCRVCECKCVGSSFR